MTQNFTTFLFIFSGCDKRLSLHLMPLKPTSVVMKNSWLRYCKFSCSSLCSLFWKAFDTGPVRGTPASSSRTQFVDLEWVQCISKWMNRCVFVLVYKRLYLSNTPCCKQRLAAEMTAAEVTVCSLQPNALRAEGRWEVSVCRGSDAVAFVISASSALRHCVCEYTVVAWENPEDLMFNMLYIHRVYLHSCTRLRVLMYHILTVIMTQHQHVSLSYTQACYSWMEHRLWWCFSTQSCSVPASPDHPHPSLSISAATPLLQVFLCLPSERLPLWAPLQCLPRDGFPQCLQCVPNPSPFPFSYSSVVGGSVFCVSSSFFILPGHLTLRLGLRQLLVNTWSLSRRLFVVFFLRSVKEYGLYVGVD